MRQGKQGMGIVIGFLLGLIIIVFFSDIAAMVFDRATSDIDNFQSCNEGLVGTLGGGEGKCVARSDCTAPDGSGGTSSRFGIKSYWQNIGKGWGCPEKISETGEGPYCCIKIPWNKNPVNVQSELAQQFCGADTPGGTLRISRGEFTCLPLEHAHALISVEENFDLRYYPKDKGTECEVHIDIAGKPYSQKFNCIKPFTTIEVDSSLASIYVADHGGDPVVLNELETVSFTVKEKGKIVTQAKLGVNVLAPFCSRDSHPACLPRELKQGDEVIGMALARDGEGVRYVTADSRGSKAIVQNSCDMSPGSYACDFNEETARYFAGKSGCYEVIDVNGNNVANAICTSSDTPNPGCWKSPLTSSTTYLCTMIRAGVCVQQDSTRGFLDVHLPSRSATGVAGGGAVHVIKSSAADAQRRIFSPMMIMAPAPTLINVIIDHDKNLNEVTIRDLWPNCNDVHPGTQ